MKYIFHIRPWFIDIFLELEEKILEKDTNATFLYLTMYKQCFNELKEKHKNTYYLPDEFKKFTSVNHAELCKFDDLIYKHCGYRLNYLIETERFLPKKVDIELFTYAHTKWFMENIKEKSYLISLSCDHFVYSLSGSINLIKGGENIYVQPVGFPINGNIVLSSPWQLKLINKYPLDKLYVYKYVESLKSPPTKTIHYMKPKPKIPLFSAIRNRYRLSKNIFLKKIYLLILEEKPNFNIIPDRIRKTKLPKFINLVGLDFINQKKISGSKIFYIPLQYEPEMSILSFSPFFKDQFELVRLTSQSISIIDIIIVKENPLMIGRRSIDFYKNLCKFHNVYIVEPSTNSREIIRHSFKVISITGTACIEAAFLGVNSLLFGLAPLRNLLIEDVLTNTSLSSYPAMLYKSHTQDEILLRATNSWEEISKSFIIGNFIPIPDKNNEYIIEDKGLLIESISSIMLK